MPKNIKQCLQPPKCTRLSNLSKSEVLHGLLRMPHHPTRDMHNLQLKYPAPPNIFCPHLRCLPLLVRIAPFVCGRAALQPQIPQHLPYPPLSTPAPPPLSQGPTLTIHHAQLHPRTHHAPHSLPLPQKCLPWTPLWWPCGGSRTL